MQSFFLLRHRRAECERIQDQFIIRFYAAGDLLHAIRRTAVDLYLDPSEAIRSLLAEDPIFVMQAHDRRARYNHSGAYAPRTESRHSEHAGPQRAVTISEHDAHFGRSRIGIENAGDV